jgi:hypothetical protein
MRYVLNRFEYTDRDDDVVRRPDPKIVGPASLAVDVDDSPAVFPTL